MEETGVQDPSQQNLRSNDLMEKVLGKFSKAGGLILGL